MKSTLTSRGERPALPLPLTRECFASRQGGSTDSPSPLEPTVEPSRQLPRSSNPSKPLHLQTPLPPLKPTKEFSKQYVLIHLTSSFAPELTQSVSLTRLRTLKSNLLQPRRRRKSDPLPTQQPIINVYSKRGSEEENLLRWVNSSMGSRKDSDGKPSGTCSG